jgi:hypothetical protein
MNVFLLSHIKALIYISPVDSDDDLIARISEAAATIRQLPGIFERTRHSPLRLRRLCIEVGGRTFEHLLQIGTKYNFFRVLMWFRLISNHSQTQFDCL